MKRVAKLLLLTMFLTSCLTFVGCIKLIPSWRGYNKDFMVTINGVSGKDILNFEISKSYTIKVRLFGNIDINDDTYKDIKIECNEENTVVSYMYHQPHTTNILFNIYCSELGSDDTLKITYGGESIEVKYNVLDYDFEANGWIKPTSLEDLDKYPAFKEMISSIEYYEFKEPYIGLDRWEYDLTTDGLIYFMYNDYENYYISNDYLQYLLDSVYYPSKFIGYNMGMLLNEGTDVSEGASRSKMREFGLNLSVSDPHHNKRSDSITGLYFRATDMENFTYMNGEKCIYPMVFLLERYPDQFFQYKIDDITIYIISTADSGAKAYFAHGDYFYMIEGFYDFD